MARDPFQGYDDWKTTHPDDRPKPRQRDPDDDWGDWDDVRSMDPHEESEYEKLSRRLGL